MKSTVGELSLLVGGEIAAGSGDTRFDGGVSIDSRILRSGDLFFAIAGPRHDGHDHVSEAVRKGASGVVVARRIAVEPEAFALLVPDTTRALQD
ncbi:MAG: Mur ligase domain-containing protein, partial [Vicinamibacteria bacterium]